MSALLASLSPVDWVCIAAGSWIVLAFVVAVPIGRAMAHADAQHAAEDVRWEPWLPPVPDAVLRLEALPPVPPTRSELAWLRDQPGVILAGRDLRWRFDDVINSARRAEQDAA